MPFRNIAIIAHVDHGKTTLVDKMLRQAGVFRPDQQVEDRVMDSNPLERERGITILSKNASLHWRHVKINIVDTPGHADFGGEVERILRMVDGVLLLVDAVEGPMPQTRFVTRKALDLGLSPIIVINKVDRADARPAQVHDEVLELFIELEASEQQLDSPFLYTSAREGRASPELDAPGDDLTPLFEAILEHVPPPDGDADDPFRLLVSTIDYSPYVGRIGIGRIEAGAVSVDQEIAVLPVGEPGPVAEEDARQGRVLKLFGFEGLERVDSRYAVAGDIVGIAGVEGMEIGVTVTTPDRLHRLPAIAVEEPTLSVDFAVNDSPFAGEAGTHVTSRELRERLYRELERNLALGVAETDRPEVLCVSGRGDLHLAILMETLRREGYEFLVSRPRVILRQAGESERLEPYEELVIDVPSNRVGVVMEKLGPRRGELVDMKSRDGGSTRLVFTIPARGLFGYRSEFLTDTSGEGALHHRFLDYRPWAGTLVRRRQGVLVADRRGVAVAYALSNLQERATLFVQPGDLVYEGMIVGEHVRPNDLDVNVTKEKKLSNVRAAGSDEMIRLEPPRAVTLEFALEFIEDDELIEVTPTAIRLRKRTLDATARRKQARAASDR